jgi:hypothetical protein
MLDLQYLGLWRRDRPAIRFDRRDRSTEDAAGDVAGDFAVRQFPNFQDRIMSDFCIDFRFGVYSTQREE